jgi:hypothetical protein
MYPISSDMVHAATFISLSPLSLLSMVPNASVNRKRIIISKCPNVSVNRKRNIIAKCPLPQLIEKYSS